MKHTTVLGLVAIILLTGAGCMKKPQAVAPLTAQPEPMRVTDQAMPSSPETMMDETGASLFAVNVAESTVEWHGERKVGNKHTGTILVKEGEIVVKNGVPLRGSVVVDMASLHANDSAAAMVDKHLKSDDFFAVETYPTAMFTFKSATKTAGDTYEVTGDLTIKDHTNSITIPATIVRAANGTYVGDASFSIDRTKWDIRYGSGKFFDSLGDKVIEDTIDFKVHLTTGGAQEIK